MQIELIIDKLTCLKKELYYKRIVLKNYCERKEISYTSTSRILKKGIQEMNLRTAFNILGLTPERNIPQVVLDTKIKNLLELKNIFKDDLL